MLSKINFYSHSGLFTLETQLTVNDSLENVWNFFSNPHNLKHITPKKMGFVISSKTDNSIFAGKIITYKVQIFPLIKNNWVTEITNVKNKSFFIDEQRIGPYRLWHHEHYFEEIKNGVLIRDKVTYKLPFGFLGKIAHGLFVKKQLKEIFNYRAEKVKTLFNTD